MLRKSSYFTSRVLYEMSVNGVGTISFYMYILYTTASTTTATTTIATILLLLLLLLLPFNGRFFQVNLVRQLDSSTCSRREPLGLRERRFYGPDVLPVTQSSVSQR